MQARKTKHPADKKTSKACIGSAKSAREDSLILLAKDEKRTDRNAGRLQIILREKGGWMRKVGETRGGNESGDHHGGKQGWKDAPLLGMKRKDSHSQTTKHSHGKT